MSEIEKKITDSELKDSAIRIYKDFLLGVSTLKTVVNDDAKRQARLYAIAELTRWQQDPAREEAIIAEINPNQDPKLYFEAIKYLLIPKHFDTIHEGVQKMLEQETNTKNIASTTQETRSDINDALN